MLPGEGRNRSCLRGAGGFPPTVVKVLDSCPTYAGCRLIEAFFERGVGLGTHGGASQTDVLVLTQLTDGFGVIAVEGKARESFDKPVSNWNTGAGNRSGSTPYVASSDSTRPKSPSSTTNSSTERCPRSSRHGGMTRAKRSCLFIPSTEMTVGSMRTRHSPLRLG